MYSDLSSEEGWKKVLLSYSWSWITTKRWRIKTEARRQISNSLRFHRILVLKQQKEPRDSILFSIIELLSAAEQKRIFEMKQCSPFSIPLIFCTAFHPKGLFVPLYFPLNFKCHFLSTTFCVPSVSMWDWGRRQHGVDNRNSTTKTARATMGVKLSQPDLCQTQGRARGERCNILWFSGAILGLQGKKENEKRDIVFYRH